MLTQFNPWSPGLARCPHFESRVLHVLRPVLLVTPHLRRDDVGLSPEWSFARKPPAALTRRV